MNCSDDKIRKSRIIKNRGYSEDYADTRMNSQLAQEIKKNLVDYTIVNNSDKKNLEVEISEFLKILSQMLQ